MTPTVDILTPMLSVFDFRFVDTMLATLHTPIAQAIWVAVGVVLACIYLVHFIRLAVRRRPPGS